MLEPLSKDELAPSEQDKVDSAFTNVVEYADIISLAIKMVHLMDNSSQNAIEAAITNLLQRALKISSGEKYT